MIDEAHITEFLRLKKGRLYHREGQELEFKEQFNLAGLADYFRDFAAFANNRGGYLIFGVQDRPRIPVGLSTSSRDQFDKVDPEKISGFLLDIYSSAIEGEQAEIVEHGQVFGVLRVLEATTRPVIARKDEGKDGVIRSGDIYFRYGGRTQRIQSAELESIINRRLQQNNAQWLGLVEKIGRAGPENAAVLDTESGTVEGGGSRILVVDEGLAEKLKFIKHGEFAETKGAEALKLTGDVVPVESIEVVKYIRENLTKRYPLSAMELAVGCPPILVPAPVLVSPRREETKVKQTRYTEAQIVDILAHVAALKAARVLTHAACEYRWNIRAVYNSRSVPSISSTIESPRSMASQNAARGPTHRLPIHCRLSRG